LEEKTKWRKVDLHVHSLYSKVEGKVLKKIIQSESYTSPREIYQVAKKRGMDFVTITDHNSIQGALQIAQLPGVFISEEVTAKFPEDGCLIHLITLKINEIQHQEIQNLKDNIYELVKYLTSQDIIFFVAHPLASVNGKLKEEHWEKMLLLFDIFEVKNGVQKEKDNLLVEKILKTLSPQKIGELANKYDITPLSKTPWIKSMVGGSDDHGGLFIGKTYTVGEGSCLNSFLKFIKEGKCKPQGKGGTYFTVGNSIYATGYRFYKNRFKKRISLNFLDKILSDERKGKILEKIFLNNGRKGPLFFPKNFLISYVIKKFSKKMPLLHILRTVRKFNKNLPSYAILFPYFYGFVYQNKDQNFTKRVKRGYLNLGEPLKVAVFADTAWDKKDFSSPFFDRSHLFPEDEEVEILCCAKKKNFSEKGLKLFHSVADFPFPFFPQINLYIPSLLEVLIYCEKKEFTVLHVLTPGSMGITGILVSKILKLPIIGTYKTDFSNLIASSDGDGGFKNMVDWYLGWFYNQMDKVVVDSKRYFDKLKDKNISQEKITIIPKQADRDSSYDLFPLLNQIPQDIFETNMFNKLREVYKEILQLQKFETLSPVTY